MLIVIYDADCGVCQASVAWLRARDRSGLFRFVGNDAPALPAGVSREETEHTVVVLEERPAPAGSSPRAGLNGRTRKYVRADAVARLLRELRAYSWLAPLLTAPGLRWLANRGYDQFAKSRHRISAALGLRACAVPPRKG